MVSFYWWGSWWLINCSIDINAQIVRSTSGLRTRVPAGPDTSASLIVYSDTGKFSN